MSTSAEGNKPNPLTLAMGMFRRIDWPRAMRLGSGLVLMIFVTLHLINHALGIVSLEEMEMMQGWRWMIWKSFAGTLLLYGAFATHIVLVLSRVVRRGTFRMPVKEAVQLVLGFTIPFLLIGHIVGTRIAGGALEVDEAYAAVLPRLWSGSALWQSLLVLVVWFHGVLGIHYVLSAKRRPRHIVDEILWAIAILLPVLSLVGFAVGAREAMGRFGLVPVSPEIASFVHMTTTEGRLAALVVIAMAAGIVTLRELNRRRRRNITVNYVGHGAITVRPGLSLLEISRERRLPHPSICGGRGRCATCRVLVTKGVNDLPAMGVAERTLLEQVAAPPGVRLACQLHPTHDLTAQILLPAMGDKAQTSQSEHAGWGMAEDATVLVVDMRAFTTLASKQVPYELVVLVNRFQEEMIQAVRAHGGRVDLVIVDGLTAVFKREGHSDHGAKNALKAAGDMLRSVEALNEQFRGALPLPLRVGIGIHTGPVLTARIGALQAHVATVALGQTVAVANRLERLTKEMLSDLVISREVAAAAGIALVQTRLQEVYVAGCETPVFAYPVNMMSEVEVIS